MQEKKDINHLPETIAYILDSISERLNTKLIVFGGSGGGFMHSYIIN